MQEWDLSDVLNLIRTVEVAMDIQILNPKISIKFNIKDKHTVNEEDKTKTEIIIPETRQKFKHKKLTIYSNTVIFKEIMDIVTLDLDEIREQLT